MSGYREHSFDPNAGGETGAPLRPFNGVQWTGVGCLVLALVGYGYYFAERTGLVPDRHFNSMMMGLPFLLLGVTLINSRRQQVVDLAPELASARRKWMLVTIAICAAILGAATIIEFKGVL